MTANVSLPSNVSELDINEMTRVEGGWFAIGFRLGVAVGTAIGSAAGFIYCKAFCK